MNNSTSNDNVHERIRQEHEELRELLGKVHHMLTQRAESVARVSETLDSLCRHIEEHFTEEEDGGFFDDISQQAPRLTNRSHDVCGEHVWLLSAIRDMNEAARDGDGSAEWWEKLNAAFHQFSKDLMHHESKENELLQDAYSEDIGPSD